MNAQPTREHPVADQPPAWSRLAQCFRRDDGTLVDRYVREEEREDARRTYDWRRDRPAWAPPRDVISRRARLRAILRRAGQWALAVFIHPDQRERRIIYTYLLLATWVVMIVIGILAKHGIHP